MHKKLLLIWRYSGALGVAIVWIGIPILMVASGLGIVDSRPISHLGVNNSTQAAFSSILLISALLFTSSALYIKHTFRTNVWFLLLFLIGQAGQIIAAFVPINTVTQFGQIHTPAAFTLAFSYPFLILAFTLSQLKSPRRNIYITLLFFELITFAVGIGLFIFTHGVAPLAEILAALGFHVWICIVTISGQKAVNR